MYGSFDAYQGTLVRFSHFLFGLQKLKQCYSLFPGERPEQANFFRQKESIFSLFSRPSAAAIMLPKLYRHARHLKIQPLSPYGFKCCYQDNQCRSGNKTFCCEITNPRWILVEYQIVQVSVGTGRFSMVGEKKQGTLSNVYRKCVHLWSTWGEKTYSLKRSSLSKNKKTPKQPDCI